MAYTEGSLRQKVVAAKAPTFGWLPKAVAAAKAASTPKKKAATPAKKSTTTTYRAPSGGGGGGGGGGGSVAAASTAAANNTQTAAAQAAAAAAADANLVSGVENELRPAFDRIYNQARYKANDQGLMQSSIYSQMNRDVAESYSANLAKAVQARRDSAQAMAAKLYELMYSGALGRATLAQSSTGIDYPTQPSWMLNTIQQPLQPQPAIGPVGDAGEVEGTRPGTTQYTGMKFYQRERDAQLDSQNAARLSLAREQFAYQKEKDATAGAGEDVWAQIATAAAQKPPTMLPTQFMNLVGSMYGVDVIDEATTRQNPRALATLKYLYPGGSWEKYMPGYQAPAPEAPASSGIAGWLSRSARVAPYMPGYQAPAPGSQYPSAATLLRERMQSRTG
jgi:hypothetical protein